MSAPRPPFIPHPPASRPPHTPLPRDAASLELSPDAMREMTSKCTEFAIRHIESLPAQPSFDLDGVLEIADSLREPPPDSGTSIEALLETLGIAVPKSFTAPGPGYLAYIPGGGLYPAALGDYIALAVNRYVGVWNAAPALVRIESTVTDWLRELVGFPAGSLGLLTSGGSMSNLIALVTARRTRLPEDFLDGVLYMSEETHHSVQKSAVLAGFRAAHVRELPVDERCRLRLDALEAAIESDRRRGRTPFLVVANAGTTNTGAIDPIPEIAGVCERHGLWLHVDAAYGGFFRLAPGGRDLLPGLEQADSATLDPHKGLFLPYGTGLLLVRDAEALRRAHTHRAGYLQDLQHPPGAISYADISPELSRDFRGLRLWLPLKLFGVAAFRDNLREKLELARWAWEELRREPGFECLDEPQLSVVAFRYRPRRGDPDEFNAQLLQRINGRKRVYISSTRLRGQYVLRFCVLSFRTHTREIQMAVEDAIECARELEAGT